MIKLIQNEIKKIFKKKSMYIALMIVFICIIAINCMNRFAGNGYEMNIDFNIENMKKELAQYDPKRASDTSVYISLKTYIDQLELEKVYGVTSWQSTIINEKMYTLIEQMNTYQYGAEKDEVGYQKVKQIYDEYIKKLDTNDWRYFANTELEENQKKIEQNEEEKKITVDKLQLKSIEETRRILELEKQVIQWRLEKDISYAESDKNTALTRYQNYQQQVISYEKSESEDYQEKLQYQNSLQKASTLEYRIKNDIWTQANDCRASLLNFFDQYGVILIAIIIMVAGTIVSDEFNKGTIKLLLVKPYKRWKILLSKFLTCIITMFMILMIMIIMQLLVGGILFGFDSLAIPEIHYNFSTNQIETMNIIPYLGLTMLTQLPMYILTITIAFMLSCVFTNSALAIVIALLGFMSTQIINMMAIELKLEFMKFFITPNWNLTPYLFGGLPDFEGLTMGFSLAINILYLVVMLIISFVAFNKKNIKNI